jgi:hypothetical protein
VVCAVCRLVPRRISSRCMFLRCESAVACCMTQVPSRIFYLVCCLTHLACRQLDVAKRAFSVASCLLSMPIPFWHVICRMSSVATLQSNTAPSHTRRIAAALAIERFSVQGMRACDCVRACG